MHSLDEDNAIVIYQHIGSYCRLADVGGSNGAGSSGNPIVMDWLIQLVADNLPSLQKTFHHS